MNRDDRDEKLLEVLRHLDNRVRCIEGELKEVVALLKAPRTYTAPAGFSFQNHVQFAETYTITNGTFTVVR